MSSDDSALDRESEIPFSRNYNPGDLVAGKYRLESVLGEGGMGMVWLAVNQALDSRVALKLIRSELSGQDAADRLLKEARAAAKLEHRGIVRVFDYGQTEFGDPFIVMELLDGRSFGEVLDKHSRISAIRSVQTMLPVIDALSFAHKHGIVHRDLKPDNIFLARQTKRTQPKVVDFGIAKFEQDGQRNLTQHGVVIGSPGYMAPEQARGLTNVDHRADIWAVCVVLYEAITGRAAFEGDNYNAMMRAIIEDDVIPVTELAAGDDALWQILEKGLAKDREQRWSTMRDLGSALAEWLLQRGVDRDVTGESLEQIWMTEADEGGKDVFSAPPPASEAALSLGRMSYHGAPTTPGDGLLPPGSLRAPGVPGGSHSSGPPPTTGAVVSIRPSVSTFASTRTWAPWAFGAALAGLVAFFVLRPVGAPPVEETTTAGAAPEAASQWPQAEDAPKAEAEPRDEAPTEPAKAAEPAKDDLEFEEVEEPAGEDDPATKPAAAAGAEATSPPAGAPTAAVPNSQRAAKPATNSTWRPKPAKKKEAEPPQAPVLKDPYQ